MKTKLLALALLTLVGAITARAQGRLLPATTTVDATSDTTVNATLDRGFLLSGTFPNTPDFQVYSIAAVSTTSAATFKATIVGNTYRVALPPQADAYNLEIEGEPVGGGPDATYIDSTSPTPFTVSGDTVRNISLPPPPITASAVTVTVSNLITHQIPGCGNPGLVLDSTIFPGYIDVNAGMAALNYNNGTFALELPIGGTFIPQLLQYFVDPNNVCGPLRAYLISNLSPVTVTNPLNLTAPTINTATLSGTVSITGGVSPASGYLQIVDISQPAPATSIYPSVWRSADTGAYNFPLVAGNTYALTWGSSVALLPALGNAGLGTYSTTVTIGTISADTVFNPTFLAPPGAVTGVTLSGRVTVAGTTKPVPFASVSASGNQIIGALNTSFDTSVKADANGNYSLVVPAGTNYTMTFSGGQLISPGDFNGDGVTDYSIFRPSDGSWYLNENASKLIQQSWGTNGDVPVRGDYDGDTKTDFGVWRPSTGQWFIIPSGNPGAPIVQQWGTSGDIAVPGDYDGDGKTDLAVWRPSTGEWFIIPSSNPGNPIIHRWGTGIDVPIPGDYDGDGRTDFAVWRPSTGEFFVIPSSNPNTPIVKPWGMQGDVPVPGDYDGDGKTDLAVWRPSTGEWFIILSSDPSSPKIANWGTSGDVPVPGDYDADGLTDIAVWRPANGTFYVIPSSAPATPIVTQWGTTGDIPTQKPIGQ